MTAEAVPLWPADATLADDADSKLTSEARKRKLMDDERSGLDMFRDALYEHVQEIAAGKHKKKLPLHPLNTMSKEEIQTWMAEYRIALNTMNVKQLALESMRHLFLCHDYVILVPNWHGLRDALWRYMLKTGVETPLKRSVSSKRDLIELCMRPDVKFDFSDYVKDMGQNSNRHHKTERVKTKAKRSNVRAKKSAGTGAGANGMGGVPAMMSTALVPRSLSPAPGSSSPAAVHAAKRVKIRPRSPSPVALPGSAAGAGGDLGSIGFDPRLGDDTMTLTGSLLTDPLAAAAGSGGVGGLPDLSFEAPVAVQDPQAILERLAGGVMSPFAEATMGMQNLTIEGAAGSNSVVGARRGRSRQPRAPGVSGVIVRDADGDEELKDAELGTADQQLAGAEFDSGDLTGQALGGDEEAISTADYHRQRKQQAESQAVGAFGKQKPQRQKHKKKQTAHEQLQQMQMQSPNGQFAFVGSSSSSSSAGMNIRSGSGQQGGIQWSAGALLRIVRSLPTQELVQFHQGYNQFVLELRQSHGQARHIQMHQQQPARLPAPTPTAGEGQQGQMQFQNQPQPFAPFQHHLPPQHPQQPQQLRPGLLGFAGAAAGIPRMSPLGNSSSISSNLSATSSSGSSRAASDNDSGSNSSGSSPRTPISPNSPVEPVLGDGGVTSTSLGAAPMAIDSGSSSASASASSFTAAPSQQQQQQRQADEAAFGTPFGPMSSSAAQSDMASALSAPNNYAVMRRHGKSLLVVGNRGMAPNSAAALSSAQAPAAAAAPALPPLRAAPATVLGSNNTTPAFGSGGGSLAAPFAPAAAGAALIDRGISASPDLPMATVPDHPALGSVPTIPLPSVFAVPLPQTPSFPAPPPFSSSQPHTMAAPSFSSSPAAPFPPAGRPRSDSLSSVSSMSDVAASTAGLSRLPMSRDPSGSGFGYMEPYSPLGTHSASSADDLFASSVLADPLQPTVSFSGPPSPALTPLGLGQFIEPNSPAPPR